MKKRIGIDARLINQTGVGVYIRNLLLYLDQYISNEVELHIYLRKQDEKIITFKNALIIKHNSDYQWHSLSEQTGFLKQLIDDKLDLMHFTYFSFPIFYPRPFVITIHDLIPLNYSTGKASTKSSLHYGLKSLAYRLLLSKALSSSKAILTPSNTIKKEISTYFGRKTLAKTVVTYEGVNKYVINAHMNKKLEQQYSKPFFIYIGNFYPHKNVENLIRGFAHSHSLSKLILIGPEDFFSQKIRRIIDEENAQNKILFYHNATAEDLLFFYTHAKGLIHPSIAEGFGLTIIEALYFDCPTIASDIPVFRELYDDSLTFFDPNDMYEIARTVDDFEAKKTLMPKINKKLLFKKYSFDEMTKKTLEVYKNNLNHIRI